jgi:hypothetical protein
LLDILAGCSLAGPWRANKAEHHSRQYILIALREIGQLTIKHKAWIRQHGGPGMLRRHRTRIVATTGPEIGGRNILPWTVSTCSRSTLPFQGIEGTYVEAPIRPSIAKLIAQMC